MIIKRAIAVESLTKVCEESLNLIKQLIDADNEVYAKGYEDGMAAESEVQKTLRPWVVLTDKEIEEIWKIAMFADYGIGAELSNQPFVHFARAIEAKLKEKNT
jgi:hypothetical protein